jgi:hypothetical protein
MLMDKLSAVFSVYKSTASLRSTVKAEKTIMPMSCDDDHAGDSVIGAKKLRRGRTSSRYELLWL